jgi:hypothetical protein
MDRRKLIQSTLAASAGILLPAEAISQSSAQTADLDSSGRVYWLGMLDRVCRPVLTALKGRELAARMPVETALGSSNRRKVTYLEALGRTLAGIAPWLENGEAVGDEGRLLTEYRSLSLAAIAAAVDPASPDYMHFGVDNQNIVDASFLALAMLRAPRQLQQQMPAQVRTQLADGLRKTRPLTPAFNNWLLFSAAIEACLFALGEEWDRARVDYALREHAAWYLGDGVYGDGPQFHWDYYNSFVIHPYLLQLMDTMAGQQAGRAAMKEPIQKRAQRYAAIQERLINTDGTYPVAGRSISYRCGAFHLLADIALRQRLPPEVSPAQVRCALGAVIARTLGAANTFDEKGWLRIGLAGHQPALGETYISTGSLYLCTAAFLPLGLPASNPFWSGAAAAWTAQKLWRGDNLPADHAVEAQA